MLGLYGMVEIQASGEPHPIAGAKNEQKLLGVGSSARLCQKSLFRKCGLTKSMTCKAHIPQKRGFDTVWCLVRRHAWTWMMVYAYILPWKRLLNLFPTSYSTQALRLRVQGWTDLGSYGTKHVSAIKILIALPFFWKTMFVISRHRKT